jgi:hypothetical protein
MLERGRDGGDHARRGEAPGARPRHDGVDQALDSLEEAIDEIAELTGEDT